MDFLGLKTLTIIKDAVANVEETKGVKLDPDEFSLQDPKTYELFQHGDTIGIFQYEFTMNDLVRIIYNNFLSIDIVNRYSNLLIV